MLKQYHQTSLLIVEGRVDGVKQVGTLHMGSFRDVNDDVCEVGPACGEVDGRQESSGIRKVRKQRARDLGRDSLSVRRVALRGRGIAAASIECKSQCGNSMADWDTVLWAIVDLPF